MPQVCFNINKFANLSIPVRQSNPRDFSFLFLVFNSTLAQITNDLYSIWSVHIKHRDCDRGEKKFGTNYAWWQLSVKSVGPPTTVNFN